MILDSRSTLRSHTAGLADRAVEEGINSFERNYIHQLTQQKLNEVVDEGEVETEASNDRDENLVSIKEPDGEIKQLQPTSKLSHILDGIAKGKSITSVSSMSNNERSIYATPESVGQSTPLLKTSEDKITESRQNSPSVNNESLSYHYHTFSDDFNRDVETQTAEEDHQQVVHRPTIYRRVRKWAGTKLTREAIVQEFVRKPVQYMPSVLLGTLLNILDGLSYGMILFPLGTPLFSHLGMAGLSMFYVSCIVSQLVYSLGGSMFKGGTGGEMVEVVPFFHSMANVIMLQVGEDKPTSVIATTITSFALSSIVTGLVFFGLGYARLGSLIGFFPRHILVGCVGGVGWFLFVTGIEVASRLGTLEYTLTYFEHLFEPDVILKWTSPLALALLLVVIQRFSHHPLVLPTYFLSIFAFFHLIVYLVPSLSLEKCRAAGWVFQAPQFSEPWYSFYTLYDFKKVDYLALVRTFPAMLALTFFGILHVPINVPALAASIGEDNVDVNRELIAHGLSNALSGMAGSIQNYLVYTNSLLFIKSGADSRLAGVMLALTTFGVMVVGPVLIGFIPVMVVGALIFLLGMELVQEALVDTYGKLSKFEYSTIVIIVLTMGVWDFVYGIIIGIILACVSFVIQASQVSAIKATYTGAVARSTVRRPIMQQKFLRQVGQQIYVLKLTGSIFFGTIVQIEATIRKLIDELHFARQPIRYLVFDISAVSEIDFSAAEAFGRMNRLLISKKVFMLLCGATEDVKVLQGLKAIKFWDNNDTVRLFMNLNLALEWCENEFLSHYYHQLQLYSKPTLPSRSIDAELQPQRFMEVLPYEPSLTNYGVSPRAVTLQKAAELTAKEDIQNVSKWKHFQQPLPVMMQIFRDVSDQNEDFWHKIAPYFERQEFKAGQMLYQSETEATGFYLVESGMLRADYDLEQGQLYESILAGTTCGELPFFSQTNRTATVSAEVDSVVWKLDIENWEKLRSGPNGTEIANEFLTIALKLTVERVFTVTAYVLISSS